MTGKLFRGAKLVQPDAMTKRGAEPVTFRGFGAVKAQDEYGLTQWTEVAFVETLDGRVLSLNVGYMEGFEVASGSA